MTKEQLKRYREWKLELDEINDEINEKSILEKYTHIDKLNRRIIDEFISKILIGKKDENNNRPIKIFWNFTI